jgi:hypothetical protein
MAFIRNGITVEVVGEIKFNDKTGYTCQARARGKKGGWEHATASGDTTNEAVNKAYDRASKKVRDKGNA